VVSRTSAFCFKSRHADVRSIGRRLATRTLLEGTVHRSGDRVQITVALIDARSGYQRWAARYEPSFAELRKSEKEISAALLEQLEPRPVSLAAVHLR
jgi:adenylate cyclase